MILLGFIRTYKWLRRDKINILKLENRVISKIVSSTIGRVSKFKLQILKEVIKFIDLLFI